MESRLPSAHWESKNINTRISTIDWCEPGTGCSGKIEDLRFRFIWGNSKESCFEEVSILLRNNEQPLHSFTAEKALKFWSQFPNMGLYPSTRHSRPIEEKICSFGGLKFLNKKSVVNFVHVIDGSSSLNSIIRMPLQIILSLKVNYSFITTPFKWSLRGWKMTPIINELQPQSITGNSGKSNRFRHSWCDSIQPRLEGVSVLDRKIERDFSVFSLGVLFELRFRFTEIDPVPQFLSLQLEEKLCSFWQPTWLFRVDHLFHLDDPITCTLKCGLPCVHHSVAILLYLTPLRDGSVSILPVPSPVHPS